MTDDPKPAPHADAVMIPAATFDAAAIYPYDRLLWAKSEFGALLGSPCGRVSVYPERAGRRFAVGGTGDAIAKESPDFPALSPRAGQSRYTWTDRGDGVLVGVKVADADAYAHMIGRPQ